MLSVVRRLYILVKISLILILIGGVVFLPESFIPFKGQDRWRKASLAKVPEPFIETPQKSHFIHIFEEKEDTIKAYTLIRDAQLYSQNWDTLYQVKFWQYLMDIHPDTSVINLAHNRRILGKIATLDWDRMSKRKQNRFKQNLLTEFDLGKDTQIYITSGRSHFYKFESMIPQISKAVKIFEKENVDPWYAQAILLIESPNRIQRSTAGAYGAFQLMRSVARELGLKVNGSQDERKIFERSAWAAAKFLRKTCIKEAKRILDRHNIKYSESDLWFKLLVLHVYHAGSRNVAAVINKIKPQEGNVELIHNVWKTTSNRFGNASQNYTQIVVATLIELDSLIVEKYRWEWAEETDIKKEENITL